jgi:hypothetical protein
MMDNNMLPVIFERDNEEAELQTQTPTSSSLTVAVFLLSNLAYASSFDGTCGKHMSISEKFLCSALARSSCNVIASEKMSRLAKLPAACSKRS